MDIAELSTKALLAKGYEQPRIEVGNYYLKWNRDKSYGIHPKEISELKAFIRNAIPFFDTSYELLNNLERPKYKGKYHSFTQFSPSICLSHRNKDHTVNYELHMITDGSTFIERVEKIEVVKNNNDKNDNLGAYNADVQGHHAKPILYLRWKLGELLFYRQGR